MAWIEGVSDSYHLLKLGGNVFAIDGDVRREIEVFMRSDPGRSDFLVVETLLGEELTVPADYVAFICSATPETRARERALNKRCDDEIPVDER